MHADIPLPNVFKLKRAVYGVNLAHGILDMHIYAHRDFAFGLLGGAQVVAMGDPTFRQHAGAVAANTNQVRFALLLYVDRHNSRAAIVAHFCQVFRGPQQSELLRRRVRVHA